MDLDGALDGGWNGHVRRSRGEAMAIVATHAWPRIREGTHPGRQAQRISRWSSRRNEGNRLVPPEGPLKRPAVALPRAPPPPPMMRTGGHLALSASFMLNTCTRWLRKSHTKSSFVAACAQMPRGDESSPGLAPDPPKEKSHLSLSASKTLTRSLPWSVTHTRFPATAAPHGWRSSPSPPPHEPATAWRWPEEEDLRSLEIWWAPCSTTKR